MIRFHQIFALLLVVGGCFPAWANNLNGYFVCSYTMSDGSGDNKIIKISGQELKMKSLGDDDTLYSDFSLIYQGKTNEFSTFVQTGNFIQEQIIVLRETEQKNIFHLNGISTSDGWSAKSRVIYGTCEKI